jgi:hypothetical protein
MGMMTGVRRFWLSRSGLDAVRFGRWREAVKRGEKNFFCEPLQGAGPQLPQGRPCSVNRLARPRSSVTAAPAGRKIRDPAPGRQGARLARHSGHREAPPGGRAVEGGEMGFNRGPSFGGRSTADGGRAPQNRSLSFVSSPPSAGYVNLKSLAVRRDACTPFNVTLSLAS